VRPVETSVGYDQTGSFGGECGNRVDLP